MVQQHGMGVLLEVLSGRGSVGLYGHTQRQELVDAGGVMGGEGDGVEELLMEEEHCT